MTENFVRAENDMKIGAKIGAKSVANIGAIFRRKLVRTVARKLVKNDAKNVAKNWCGNFLSHLCRLDLFNEYSEYIVLLLLFNCQFHGFLTSKFCSRFYDQF